MEWYEFDVRMDRNWVGRVKAQDGMDALHQAERIIIDIISEEFRTGKIHERVGVAKGFVPEGGHTTQDKNLTTRRVEIAISHREWGWFPLIEESQQFMGFSDHGNEIVCISFVAQKRYDDEIILIPAHN